MVYLNNNNNIETSDSNEFLIFKDRSVFSSNNKSCICTFIDIYDLETFDFENECSFLFLIYKVNQVMSSEGNNNQNYFLFACILFNCIRNSY